MHHEIDVSTRKNFNVLTQSKNKIVTLEGGSGCFKGDQKVITAEGSKPISEINTFDSVLSYDKNTNQRVFKPVNKVFKYKNSKKCIRIKLKNGKTITGTEDHEFYYKGAWKSLKHIVSLLDERNMENNSGI